MLPVTEVGSTISPQLRVGSEGLVVCTVTVTVGATSSGTGVTAETGLARAGTRKLRTCPHQQEHLSGHAPLYATLVRVQGGSTARER